MRWNIQKSFEKLRGIQGLVGIPRRKDGTGRNAGGSAYPRDPRGARCGHKRGQIPLHGRLGLSQIPSYHALFHGFTAERCPSSE